MDYPGDLLPALCRFHFLSHEKAGKSDAELVLQLLKHRLIITLLKARDFNKFQALI
jgi:hypothetical protein